MQTEIAGADIGSNGDGVTANVLAKSPWMHKALQHYSDKFKTHCIYPWKKFFVSSYVALALMNKRDVVRFCTTSVCR